jgi:fructose-specific component phosphotransferase system IIB-like protein
MVRERIVDLLKNATAVNLRYSAVTLKLAREYIKELDGVVRHGVAGGEDSDQPSTAPTPGRRASILLVGQTGTQATGAFILNNTADADLTVALVVQGELGPVETELVPASLVIGPGDSAVVQLKVTMTDAMEIGRDYGGAVVAPSLAAQPVEFVVRRLPDEAPAKRTRKAKARPDRRGG